MLLSERETHIQKIRNGDLRAFYEVYEKYHGKLYQYFYKYTQSAYYAEEAVQLAFIKLWERRETLSDQYNISTQLFRIAKNCLIDLLRKEKLRVTQPLSDIYISGEREAERLIHKEELQQVLSAIEELPDQCREVFTMSRINQLSHKEISMQLSISPKTIETHITKALKFLRKSLTSFFC